MDSNQPVAKRTRLKEAEYFKRKHEEIRRERCRGSSSSASGTSSLVRPCEVGGESSYGSFQKANANEKLRLGRGDRTEVISSSNRHKIVGSEGSKCERNGAVAPILLNDSEDDAAFELDGHESDNMVRKERNPVSNEADEGGQCHEKSEVMREGESNSKVNFVCEMSGDCEASSRNKGNQIDEMDFVGKESARVSGRSRLQLRKMSADVDGSSNVVCDISVNAMEVSDVSSSEDLEEDTDDSEDEDNGDPDDEEFHISKSDNQKKFEGKKVERVKRTRWSGLELLSDSCDENMNAIDKSMNDYVNNDLVQDSVAKRTRSHYHSESNNNKRRKAEALSNTNRVDEDTNKPKHKQKLWPNKAVITLKDQHGYIKMLANSILRKGEIEVGGPVTEPTLPLKFTLRTEESPPQKSEEEKQLDELWNEMAMCLALSEGNAADESAVENEAEDSAEVEDRDTLCRKGNHELILDEEIGLICKFCPFVHQEIRYWVPSFSKSLRGKPGARREGSFTTDEDLRFDNLHHQDIGRNTQHRNDLHSHVQGTVWDLIPGIGKNFHEHQREGFEFLWKSIAGDIYLEKLRAMENSKGETGSGCVISHAPGTGKTRLTLAFLQSYLELYPESRPVIIAPCSMLLTWEAEFRKWGINIPFHNLRKAELSGQENGLARRSFQELQPKNRTTKAVRWVKLYSWTKEKSILGISYGLLKRLFSVKAKKQGRVQHKDETTNESEILLEFPGLVVLDEGHTPRSKRSVIFNAVSKFHTQKRIILTGTPFQNNFTELFNSLSLVRPKFADRICSKYGRGSKKSEASCNWNALINLVGKDDKVDAKRLEEVKEIIRPFVHVYRGNILQESLPGLRESLVILEPVHLQKNILQSLQGVKHDFHHEVLVSLVSVHPSLLIQEKIENKGIVVDFGKLKRLRLHMEAGVKTRFLRELIRISIARNERVLVFSQMLAPLVLISEQLESQFKWTQGREILYMHGQLSAELRQSLIKEFNDRNSDSKVMLASTKACSEGINLVGASRVVLLDVEWNPSVERQAISRAYRLGQEKVVHVYHLLTAGSREEEKYRRQVGKERMAELVFYSADNVGRGQKLKPNFSDDERDKVLEEMIEQDKLKDMFQRIIYQPKDSLIESCGSVGS